MMRDTAGALAIGVSERGNGESPDQCGTYVITRYAFLPKECKQERFCAR